MTEERKERIENKYSHNRNDFNTTPNSKKTEKFVTNLVPYEKNESCKVNASALDDNQKKYYNYLGEKENPTAFVPLSNVNAQRNLFFEGFHNGETDKTPVKTKIDGKKGHSEHKTDKKVENKGKRMDNKETVSGFKVEKEPEEWTRHVEPKAHVEKKEHKAEAGHGSKTGTMPKKVTSPNGAVPKR